MVLANHIYDHPYSDIAPVHWAYAELYGLFQDGFYPNAPGVFRDLIQWGLTVCIEPGRFGTKSPKTSSRTI